MKKLRTILSTLGVIGIAFNFSTVYGQEWIEMSSRQIQQVSSVTPQTTDQMPRFQAAEEPLPQQYAAAPYYPAPSYAAEKSFDDLVRDIEDLKKELAKKSDKPDPKKAFTAPKISGRVFMDSVNIMNQDADGLASYDGRNSWGFREARLAATGEGYGFLDYKLEIGFENEGGANFKDVFLGIKYVPLLGYVRIGNQYVEDAGSEICNGTTNYTFMEAPAPAGNHFTSRRLGISSRHLFARDRGRLFLGAYGAQNVAEKHLQIYDAQGLILNARLTYAPMFQKEGKCMFLYGGYYSFADLQGKAQGNNFRLRPGGWDLGMPSGQPVTADNIHKAGFETVYQNGAFCLQTDFYLKHFSDVSGEDPMLYGGFVMGRLFLTKGDYRKYNLESAAWSSVVVNCPFLLFQRGACNFMQGPGAWEVATYYGFLNNDDFKDVSGISYGTEHQIGVALNWYWNPQLKWALNYVHQTLDITDVGGQKCKPNTDALGLSCRFHW